MNSLLILSAIAVLIQPCADRDTFIAQYGGQPFGKCTIIYQDDQLPLALAGSYETNVVRPIRDTSWFEGAWMQMDEVQNVLGYSGQNMVVEVMDGGTVNASHQELAGHVQNLDASSEASHADSTTGIIVGQGSTSAKYRGMAPDAFAYIRDYNGDFIREKESDFEPRSVSADNNSWGYILGWTWGSSKPEYWCFNTSTYDSTGWGDYDGSCNEIDSLIFPMGSESPLKTIMVFSSGNDRNEYYPSNAYGGHYHCYCPDSHSGCDHTLHTDDHASDPDYGSMGNVGCAKNQLAVGAVSYDDRTHKYRLAGFSSSGPCETGSVKPDFVAPGVDISTIGYTGYVQGTSFAAPYITGIASVISQKWQEIWGSFADISIVRGFLAHTALDLSDGPDPNGPDYRFGFGLPQAKDAIELMDQTTYYTQGSITADEDQTYDITHDGASPLRCTLSWVDYNGVYINENLDLSIEGASNTYYPYILDPENPSDPENPLTPTATGINNLDVLEMVDVCDTPPCDTSPAGDYTVKVYANWPIDLAPQPYLLICSDPIGGGTSCNGAGEPNNTFATARYLLYSGTISTDLCPAGDIDYLTFDQFADGPCTITVTGGNLTVELLDANQNTIASGTTIDQSNLSRGAYWIKISTGAGTVNYSLTLSKEDYAHGRPSSRPH